MAFKLATARHDIAPDICSRAVNNQVHARSTRAAMVGVACLPAPALFSLVSARIVATSGRCEACNTPMRTLQITGAGNKTQGNGSGRAPHNAMSIHKVRPLLGYVAGNVRILCRTCNEAIGDAATPGDCNDRINALRYQQAQLA